MSVFAERPLAEQPVAGQPHRIEIVEVGPRDGLQNEAAVLTTETKVELIRRALAAGVRRIEAVSFVHPRLVPQMADAEAVMAAVCDPAFGADLPHRDEATFIGLVLNPRGFDRSAGRRGRRGQRGGLGQ